MLLALYAVHGQSAFACISTELLMLPPPSPRGVPSHSPGPARPGTLNECHQHIISCKIYNLDVVDIHVLAIFIIFAAVFFRSPLSVLVLAVIDFFFNFFVF